jgi:general secretion pathway protein N
MIRALHPRLLLPLLLGLACVPPTTVILHELDRANAPLPTSTSAAESAAATLPLPSLVTPDAPAMQAFAEVLERPLFASTRRPFQPEPVAPPAPEPEPELVLELAGIVIAARERFALLQAGDQEPLLKVREGDSVGGWRVLEIASGGLRLARGGRERELRLDYRRHGMSQSPPAIPAPAAAQ